MCVFVADSSVPTPSHKPSHSARPSFRMPVCFRMSVILLSRYSSSLRAWTGRASYNHSPDFHRIVTHGLPMWVFTTTRLETGGPAQKKDIDPADVKILFFPNRRPKQVPVSNGRLTLLFGTGRVTKTRCSVTLTMERKWIELLAFTGSAVAPASPRAQFLLVFARPKAARTDSVRRQLTPPDEGVLHRSMSANNQ